MLSGWGEVLGGVLLLLEPLVLVVGDRMVNSLGVVAEQGHRHQDDVLDRARAWGGRHRAHVPPVFQALA